MSSQHPLRRDIDTDSNSVYHVNDSTDTAQGSLSSGHILQPQPVMATPGSLVWGTERVYDENSFGTTYFPGPDNSLGLFDTDPKHWTAASSPRASPRHPPTPPSGLEIQGYEIEGGWSLDGTHYVPHHRAIEEVDEDVDANVLHLANHSAVFPEQLPATTTPPPRPKQRPIELIPSPLLDRLPLGDESNTRTDLLPPSPHHHEFSRSFEFKDHSTTVSTCSSPTNLLTHSQELSMVEQILASIRIGFMDIMSLHTKFGVLPASDGTGMCNTVTDALYAVQTSLKRHRAVVPEQWRLRTGSCQRKYDQRLMSLKKTLQRLHTLSTASPRINQVDKFCKLLEQYNTKLSDLAVKINATFDRLHDRHWNTWLAGVRTDLQCRVDARKKERKTARAARLGPYEYSIHRQGRRPSVVEVL
ncbi:hypothetical protein B0H16DRAFT_1559850 [Mycena metata]|uniref:Uncharacterized protein n=1 Tax=Mycena metata TaxID=1033252 RepID=A0AAD7N438_9AGAR|nr:hypothetical protein B0H16DRAFT_1559850 [Mycena metata]